MRALDPNATREFIDPSEEKVPETEQTKFGITQLSAAEQAYCQDSRGVGLTTLNAMHLGLCSLKNLLDKNGNEIKLERDQMKGFLVGEKRPWKDECLTAIPIKVRDNLAWEILTGASITRAIAKNS